MNTVIVVAALAAVVMCCLVVMKPEAEKVTGRGVSIHLPKDGAKVEVSQSPSGVRLNIVYETYEERRDFTEFIPEMVNTAPVPEHSFNMEFWMKIANLQSLPTDEREEVVGRLYDGGFIDGDTRDGMLFGDGGGAGDPSPEDGAAVPDGGGAAPSGPEMPRELGTFDFSTR